MDSETQSHSAEDELRAQLDLARRFLAEQSEEAEIELTPGVLAFELPLPPGAQVVGSMMRGGKPASMILDMPQSPEEAFAFYDEQLAALGWAADLFMGRGGFIPSTSPFIPSRYISDERGKMLIMAVKDPAESGATFVITLMDAPDKAQWARRPHPSSLHQTMPQLRAPHGARLSAEGSGGSDTSWRSYARMSTALEPEAVTAHFNKQLEAGGWRRQTGGATSDAGWSLWSVTVEAQSMIGAFIALRIPERQDEYLLEARLEAGDLQQPNGRWFSSAPLVSGGGSGRPR